LYQLVGELQLIAPVVLMSAVPPDETRTKPFWGKWFFIMRDAEQMAARVCSVAQTTRAPYLPIFERWRSHPDRLALVSDGLHCNPEGHQLLFREVSNFLLETFALEA
jgi:lysophospholipase L1-like esterase